MKRTLKILTAQDAAAPEAAGPVLHLANDTEVSELALDGVHRIDLNFPKFSDGRAFSQAFMLRKRCGFRGDIRAVGDVLIDQLVQLQRTGFSSAVLRADQDIGHAQRQFDRFAGFYQGGAVTAQPRFREAA